MKSGPKRVPTERAKSEFVKAIKSDPRLVSHLSLLGGFSPNGLSERLYKPFPATDLTMRRLKRVAEEIGYTGELLAPPVEESDEKPTVDEAAKNARPLIAETIRAIANDVPIADAALFANVVVDQAIEGRPQLALILQAVFKKILQASDEASANSNTTTEAES